ncbi:MAG TPA: hypothetical protein VJV74_17320, partial [Terriglobia bacterium]|nr:hypothetical protein [Terriglobia bacterium]
MLVGQRPNLLFEPMLLTPPTDPAAINGLAAFHGLISTKILCRQEVTSADATSFVECKYGKRLAFLQHRLKSHSVAQGKRSAALGNRMRRGTAPQRGAIPPRAAFDLLNRLRDCHRAAGFRSRPQRCT